jgi:hypothetical protein
MRESVRRDCETPDAEAVGSCHVAGSDGETVDLKAALEPFRLRG